MAEWKSIECIIGAAVMRTPGAVSSERFVIVNLMRSPTRARTAGPGTESPKVQALNFTPGAISMILCVVSMRISFTGPGTRGFSIASMFNASPATKGPTCRSFDSTAGGVLKSIFAMS